MEREENIRRLIQTLGDEDELVRLQASELLEEIGEPAVDLLIQSLDNDNKDIRKTSARVLGIIGDERAVEPLITNLRDDNKWVRRETSGALSKMGDAAVEPLIKLLNDVDWRVRGGAAWALGGIGNREAVEPLIKSLEDESGFVRSGAAWALGNIGDKRALEPLKASALHDKSSYVRKVAEKFLEKME